VNREELNWLLQTIKDAGTLQRFVLAQYERGRISFQMMADVARERGINRPQRESILDHGDPSLDRIRDGGITNCYCLRAMFEELQTVKEQSSRLGDAASTTGRRGDESERGLQVAIQFTNLIETSSRVSREGAALCR
jgi:hypothetical protein